MPAKWKWPHDPTGLLSASQASLCTPHRPPEVNSPSSAPPDSALGGQLASATVIFLTSHPKTQWFSASIHLAHQSADSWVNWALCVRGVVLLVQPGPLHSSGVRWLLAGLDWSRLGWLGPALCLSSCSLSPGCCHGDGVGRKESRGAGTFPRLYSVPSTVILLARASPTSLWDHLWTGWAAQSMAKEGGVLGLQRSWSPALTTVLWDLAESVPPHDRAQAQSLAQATLPTSSNHVWHSGQAYFLGEASVHTPDLEEPLVCTLPLTLTPCL